MCRGGELISELLYLIGKLRTIIVRYPKFLPLCVVCLLGGKSVLAAVQLNIQFRFFTKEIQVVVTERVLAAKFIATEAAISQPPPHQLFRPGFLFAEPSCQ